MIVTIPGFSPASVLMWCIIHSSPRKDYNMLTHIINLMIDVYVNESSLCPVVSVVNVIVVIIMMTGTMAIDEHI